MAGEGADTFTGPLTESSSTTAIRAPVTSSEWIQGTYWSPPATGPPMPSLKKGSIFSRAPPSGESTTPVRVVTTRTPRSSALFASASHSTTRSARKSSPAADDSSSFSSPRLP